jgi:glycine/D-amino acid oxidase-like deaminating enzyme
MRVVICGGGVIGACTAYFLNLRQVEVTVIEDGSRWRYRRLNG